MDKASALSELAHFGISLVDLGVAEPRVFLYGSYANGTQREDSDIDVVVVSESFSGMPHWERAGILSRATLATNILIEAVALTPEEWDGGEFLIAEFAKQGEEVGV